MIHLLEVGPELSIKELKKLARRYAMTGGYELALRSGLTDSDLELLVNQYEPELEQYDRALAEFRSSNAYRILLLVKNQLNEENKLVGRLNSILGDNQ